MQFPDQVNCLEVSYVETHSDGFCQRFLVDKLNLSE